MVDHEFRTCLELCHLTGRETEVHEVHRSGGFLAGELAGVLCLHLTTHHLAVGEPKHDAALNTHQAR